MPVCVRCRRHDHGRCEDIERRREARFRGCVCQHRAELTPERPRARVHAPTPVQQRPAE